MHNPNQKKKNYGSFSSWRWQLNYILVCILWKKKNINHYTWSSYNLAGYELDSTLIIMPNSFTQFVLKTQLKRIWHMNLYTIL